MSDSHNEFADWIAAARAGSGEALGATLEACRAYLQLVAYQEMDRDLLAKAGASDLVQETFLEAQRDFAQFRGATEAEFLGWLRRILLHNLANFRRSYRRTDKRQVDREVTIDAESSRDLRGTLAANVSSPSSCAIHNEETVALEDALQKLPPSYLRVITLRNRDGLSFEQIGSELNLTANAARKLWCRAIERLQRELEVSDAVDAGQTTDRGNGRRRVRCQADEAGRGAGGRDSAASSASSNR